MRTETVLTHPLIFPLSFALFIGIGALASYGMSELGYPLSPRLFCYVAAGLGAYLAGTRHILKTNSRIFFALFSIFVFVTSIEGHGWHTLVALAALFALYWQWDTVRSHALHVAVSGMVLLLINMAYIGYVPLLNPGLRHASQTLPFVFGYGLAFLGGALYFPAHRRGGALLAAAILIAVLPYGMRSYMLIFLIAVGIEAVMLGACTARCIAAFAAVAGIVLVGLGTITTLLLPQDWHLSGASLVLYRIGFTTHMLDEACRMAGWSGILHGEIWRMTATSPLVGEIVAGSGNITTTILGPLVIDGGLVEMPLMAFAGATLNTLYSRARSAPEFVPYYALVLAILLISIEISPVPLIFGLFLFALSVTQRLEEARCAADARHASAISKE